MKIVSDEIFKLVDRQTDLFRDLTADYIINNYELGVSDLIVRFVKGDVQVVKNEELLKTKHLVNVRMSHIANLFRQSVMKHPVLRDIDLIVPFCLSDTTESQMQKIPCISFCKKSYSNNILIPSYNALMGYWEISSVDFFDHPLHDKIDKMCFAGSLTGNTIEPQHNSRLKIAAQASKNPDKYFCKVFRPPMMDKDIFQRALDRCKEHYGIYEQSPLSDDVVLNSEDGVGIPEQLKYKFQICADGHVTTWARLPWQMSANCIPLKIRNSQHDWVEWFYPFLDYSKHVLQFNVEDIDEVYEYLLSDVQAQIDINNASKDFAKKYFAKDLAFDVFAQTLILLDKKQDNHFLNRNQG